MLCPVHRFKWIALAATLLLGGCGGGGGDKTPQPTLSLSTTHLSFTAYQTDTVPPASQLITGSIANATTSIYMRVEYTNHALAEVSFSQTGQTNGQLLVSPAYPANLPVGTYTDTINIRACTNSAGTQDIAGSPQVVTVTYKVNARLAAGSSALTYTQYVGGSVPADQSLSLSGPGLSWHALADQTWIKVRSTSGTAPDSLALGVDPTGLAAGTYSGNVTLTTDGTSDSLSIPVHYTLAPIALATTADSLNFSGINGAPIASAPLHVSLNSGDAKAWTATSSAPWLLLDKTSGTTPCDLAVSVNPAVGPLASGISTANLTLTATVNGTVLTRTVAVELDLIPATFTFDAASLTLGGANGRDLSSQTLQVGLGTGTNSFPWSVAADQTWLRPGSSTGTASSTPVPLTIAANPQSMVGGTYTGNVNFTAKINGDTVTASLPVTLNMESHKLLANDIGVALASTPTLHRLSRTLKIRDNLGLATPWTAQADQAWLSVTANGTTTGDLVVTANPAGLAKDQVYTGTITVTSTASGVQNSETIKVGLWVGSTDPAAVTTIPQLYKMIALDPVRPYAYFHTGLSDITVYNIYTCAVVQTFSHVGAALGDMTVALDGSMLYATDTTNYKIVPVSLPSGTVQPAWNLVSTVPAYLQYARTNGVGLVLVGDSTILYADSGLSCGIPPIAYNARVAASVLGNEYALESTVHTLDFTALNGGQVLVGPAQYPNVSAGNSEDYAFNPDGTRFYLAVGAPYDFYVVDTTTSAQTLPLIQTLPGGAYPDNVEVARDGRIFCGREAYGTSVWVYAPDGTQLATYDVGYLGLVQRQMKVSGDGIRMLSVICDGYYTSAGVVVTTVGP